MSKDFTSQQKAEQLYIDLFEFIHDFRRIMTAENSDILTDELLDIYANIGSMCEMAVDEVSEQMRTHPKAQIHGEPIDEQ